MEYTQPPLMLVAPEPAPEPEVVGPAQSLWRQEAEVAARGGELARELALTLPCGSELRERLLARADDWTMLAGLRGLRPARPSEARSRTA